MMCIKAQNIVASILNHYFHLSFGIEIVIAKM